MRVLSGTARGVPLKTVPDMETRPILDRVKKSLFSILDSAQLIQQASLMDLYAGTGTMGIEALSRGAAYCLFVEQRPEAVKLMQENLAKTRLSERADVRQGDVRRVLEEFVRAPDAARFGLILYDPPFAFSREDATRGAIEAELAQGGRLLTPEGRLVLRAEEKTEPPKPQGLTLARRWTDGPHALLFYGKG